MGGGGGSVKILGVTPGTDRWKLIGDMTEHQEGVESLGMTWEDAAERGCGYSGVRNVLQVIIPGGTDVSLPWSHG